MLFTRKNFISETVDLRDMFEKASMCVCTSNIVASPGHLSPLQSASSAMKTPENTKEDPGDAESTDEGDNQMKYSSD